MNMFLSPTPFIQDATGQLSGYIAPNVITDQTGLPITDNNGNYLTTN